MMRLMVKINFSHRLEANLIRVRELAEVPRE